MSAKHSKKAGKTAAPTSAPAPTPVTPSASANAGATATATPSVTPWAESTDPKKRLLGKFVLIGVWLYVAALWLLALDQTFNWGIFGPKLPPM